MLSSQAQFLNNAHTYIDQIDKKIKRSEYYTAVNNKITKSNITLNIALDHTIKSRDHHSGMCSSVFQFLKMS